MAEEEEKTEDPTQHRITKEREEGNVLKSIDAQAFIVLAVAFATLWLVFGFISDRLIYLYYYYQTFYGVELKPYILVDMAIVTFKEFVVILLVFSFPIIIGAVAASFLQYGFNFTLKAIAPKFSKIDPIAGIKRLFSMEKFVDSIAITLKSTLAIGVATLFFAYTFNDFYNLPMSSPESQYEWFKDTMLELIGYLLLVFLVMGLVDYFWKRYNYFKKLKMTKQEIKEEYKQMEGSPEVKQRMQQVRREIAKRQMIKKVPTADVVVTNPTHYAIALLYDRTKSASPVVVAKGVDFMAEQIKKIAREHDIPIIEDKPLARSLYASVELDQEIPGELFAAVVNVYKLIMNAKNRHKWQ